MSLYRLVRPLLFRVDPERAHHLALGACSTLGEIPAAARAAMARRWSSPADPRLATIVAGIAFPNPIGLGAGYDKSAQGIKALSCMGFGFIEVGSVSRWPSAGNPDRPRVFRLPADEALIINYGVPNDGAKAVAPRVARARCPIPIGVNIVETNTGRPVEPQDAITELASASTFFAPIASFLSISAECANAPGGHPLARIENLQRLLDAVGRTGPLPPVFVKLRVPADQIEAVLRVVDAFPFVRGFRVNTVQERPYDIKTPREQWEQMKGSLTSPALGFPAMLQAVRDWYIRADPSRYALMASGGIRTGRDAYSTMLAGASLVQSVTALIYEGPALASRDQQGAAHNSHSRRYCGRGRYRRQRPRVSRKVIMKCIVLLAVILLGAAAPSAVNVTIHDGALRGSVAAGIVSFLGIPYAAPPVGELRWRPPVAPAAWSGIRDATTFGSYCAQNGSGAFFPSPSNSEDCLYLNVFTTGDAVARHQHRPVMFWLHGGGLYGGDSNDYDMTALVGSGVVVVSINYRIGVLGFFAHPALDAEHHDLGDYGLMDQQMALRWVQRNIAAFGGDPENVTVFGESAGGESAVAHLTSPTAENLFRRVIIESGGTPALTRMVTPLTTAEATGKRFATAAGCEDQSVACLRALSAEQIAKLQQPYLTGFIGNVATLPKPFHAAFASGRFHHVPVLIGNNADEWRWIIARIEIGSGKPLTPQAYPAAVQTFFGPATATAVLDE